MTSLEIEILTKIYSSKQEFFSPLAFKKVQFRQKKFCVLKILFSYRKVSIRKQFFTGFDIKKVSHLAGHFLCLTLQKTVFRSLPFHVLTQFGEQIAI